MPSPRLFFHDLLFCQPNAVVTTTSCLYPLVAKSPLFPRRRHHRHRRPFQKDARRRRLSVDARRARRWRATPTARANSTTRAARRPTTRSKCAPQAGFHAALSHAAAWNVARSVPAAITPRKCALRHGKAAIDSQGAAAIVELLSERRRRAMASSAKAMPP